MKEGKEPDPRRRDMAYQSINGFIETEPLREREKIEHLVRQIYCHRLNLCTHTDLDFEDKDLEGIITAYEQLNHLCGNFMYNQGWADASGEV